MTQTRKQGAFRGFDPAKVSSPAFVVDKSAIQTNLDILKDVMDRSGADIILALKGFSMFHLGKQISSVLKGTTASSVHEARLGYEEFGGQVHAYAPAYKNEEMDELLQIADHIVFNSFSQWDVHREKALAAADKAQQSGKSIEFAIRINPEYSEAEVPLYDPAAPFSRMGVTKAEFKEDQLEGISGLHFHSLCEQGADVLANTLERIEKSFGHLLKQMKWLNLGGGHHITKEDYDRERLIQLIRYLSDTYDLKVYLEPGEAIAIHTGVLVSTVLDCIHNGMDIAILDTSATCHMPDVLEMPYRAEIWEAGEPEEKPYLYRLGGQTCLAGDVIGDYSFDQPLQPGDRLIFDDMSHYTMVKTTTFNGINLPSIYTYDSRDGSYELVKTFGYEDFKSRLS